MAGLSSAGIGSGLDVNGLVTQLMAVEQQPLTALAKKEAGLNAELSAYGTVKGALSALQAAASALAAPAKFAGLSAAVADPTLLSASAGSTSVAGSYSINVQSLATAQSVTSNAGTVPTVAPGTLTFTFGTYATTTPLPGTTSFTAGAGAPASVTLSAGSTLAELSSAINSVNAGVTSRIVNNGTIDQLVISAVNTGAVNGFQIAGGGGLSGFSFDASTGATSTLNPLDVAQDAKAVVGGINITSASNTVTGAITGVTLNLVKLGQTSLAVSRDTATPKAAIQAFVNAYNNVNKSLGDLSSYNAATKKGAILQGDSVVRMVQGQINRVLSSAVASSGAQRLSEIGITRQVDGSLAVDSAKLQAALDDPAKNVAGLFVQTGNLQGYAAQLDGMTTTLLAADGLLSSRTTGIGQSIKDIGRRREALNLRLATVEKTYRAQFTKLDGLITSMTNTSNFLTQQLK